MRAGKGAATALAWLWLFAPLVFMWPTSRSAVDAAASAALLACCLLWRPSMRVAAAVLWLIGLAHLAYFLAVDSLPDEYFWFTVFGSSLGEAWEYVTSYRRSDALRLAWWLLPACLALHWLWSRAGALRGRWRWLGLLSLLLWLAWSLVSCAKGNGVAGSLSKVDRVYPAAFAESYLRYRQSSAHMFAVPPAPEPAGPPLADVVVMVIGESASAQRWSLLGYRGNPTNAALAPLGNSLVALPVQANGNNTAQTVPLLLTGQQVEPVPEGGVLTYLDKAAKAGFQVVTLSNQSSFGAGQSFFFTAFRQRSSQYRPLQAGQWDGALTPLLAQALEDTPPAGRLMLTVHMYGSHPRVEGRVPPGAALWADAYDNSIAYTSALLADWVARLSQLQDRRVALLYVSDHGLAFPACGGSYVHGSTRSAYEVPLMLWGNARFRADNAAWWQQWQARARQAVAPDGRLQFTNLLVPFALDDLLGMSPVSTLVPAGPALPSSAAYPPPADERQCERFTPYDVAAALKQRR
ncbi:hypothetical protein GCM10027082_03190 [Comamonas humi]